MTGGLGGIGTREESKIEVGRERLGMSTIVQNDMQRDVGSINIIEEGTADSYLGIYRRTCGQFQLLCAGIGSTLGSIGSFFGGGQHNNINDQQSESTNRYSRSRIFPKVGCYFCSLRYCRDWVGMVKPSRQSSLAFQWNCLGYRR